MNLIWRSVKDTSPVSLWHTVFFWLQLFICIPQAFWVRRRAVRLPAASGGSSATLNYPLKSASELRLLGFGDSIIAGVGVDDTHDTLTALVGAKLSGMHQCCVHWYIEGKNGRTVSELVNLVDSLPSAMDMIIISVGVNDVTRLTQLSRWQSGIGELLTELTGKYPEARITLLGLPPLHQFPLLPWPLRSALGRRAVALDQIAEDVCSRFLAVTHLSLDIETEVSDFAADGYHPSAASYRRLAQAISESLVEQGSDAQRDVATGQGRLFPQK